MRWRGPARALTAALLCAGAAACGSGGDGEGGGDAGGDAADRLVADASTTTSSVDEAELAISPTSATTAPASTTTTAPTTIAPTTTTTAPSTTAAAQEAGTPDAQAPEPAPSGGAAAAPATTASSPPATQVPPPPATVPPPDEPYVFEVSEISAELALRMTPTSWRPGCPVALSDLRYLRVGYWGFDGAPHVGELVVHRDAAAEVGAAFAELYANRFPIRQMVLVDDFGGDDDASVDADNTSAFNCRPVTGSTDRWSQHAYGTAIDINPIENPYIGASGVIRNPASEFYRDRSTYQLGMFVEGHVGVAAFDRFGWDWGGRWSSPIDYQHFSRTGG